MVTVFGEVLWDIFGEKREIGGAPFNFAVQLKRLGIDVQLISAVGTDELGRETIEIIRKMGLEAANVGVNAYPTGYCNVTLKNGIPEYELVMPVAYDYIEMAELSGDVLYFGTLAQRGEKSRSTLSKLLENDFREIIFDINIRQNFYTKEITDESLKAATILKISREEIGVLEIEGKEEDICQEIMKKYPNLRLVIVTLDKDGAFVYDGCRFIYSEKPTCTVVSTVGAGDALAAGFMAGYLKGLKIEECLEGAMALAGEVCERLGAL